MSKQSGYVNKSPFATGREADTTAWQENSYFDGEELPDESLANDPEFLCFCLEIREVNLSITFDDLVILYLNED